jgi:NAD+ kinase
MRYKRIGIVTNKVKDPSLRFTNKIKTFLEQNGVAVSEEKNEKNEKPDFLVVLGGDGTMLRVAHYAAIDDIPLMGINLGTLGFLTDVDKHEGIAALKKVLAGNCHFEKRMMLKMQGVHPSIALNEVCVGATGKLRAFDVYINGQFLDSIRADGIIVSTPTGSTAYNLSAGGPILAACGQMIVVTPVCPHSLGSRPIVLLPTDSVRIVAKKTTSVFVDGEEQEPLKANADIVISKSEYSTTIMKTVTTNIYEVLRKKMIL